MSPRDVPLRDPALLAALDAAATGPSRDVYALLCRHSGLPGPRPNLALATAVGERIATHGRRADPLVRELASVDADRAPPGTAQEFLPVCAALALAARVRADVDRSGSLATLHEMAEDPRRLVREAVALSLVQLASAEPAFVSELASWMDGYLHAAVVLEALANRRVLDAAPTPEAILARLDEGFSLAENAPRSHERTQGFRNLVAVLGTAPVSVMARFPDATAAWLAGRASTRVPELRDAIERTLARARREGHRDARMGTIARALDASAPPRRDPTTYVGPTRGRGKKKSRGR